MPNEISVQIKSQEVAAQFSWAVPLAQAYIGMLLNSYEQPPSLLPAGPYPTADSVYSLLEVPGKYKLGTHPTGPPRKNNIAIAQSAIDQGVPIPILIVVGTSKNKTGTAPEENHVDLNELLMLKQIQRISEKVSTKYSPGIQTTLYIEDLTNQWLYSHAASQMGVALNNESYIRSLKKLISDAKSFITTPIRPITESELLAQAGINKTDFFPLCESLEQKFKRYFIESFPLIEKSQLNKSQDGWDQFISSTLSHTQSYKDLVEVGWQSGVDPSMYKYYFDRFSNSNKNIENPQEYIAAYFASIHAKRILGLMRQASQKSIKLAFVNNPPGTPPHLNSAIKLTAYPTRGAGSSSITSPPWGGEATIGVSKSNRQVSYSPSGFQDSVHSQAQVIINGVEVPISIAIRE